MQISNNLYQELLKVFKYDGKEKGGLIFIKDMTINDYYLDEDGYCDKSSYRPNGKILSNKILDATKKGYDEFAFIHCHLDNEPISSADIEWAKDFIQRNDLNEIKMFLVVNNTILCYTVTKTKYALTNFSIL